ncbi:MAG: HNH endonuclease [Methylobacteriaceae bacterium]|nr:HNH endonuclease [Rhodoblastus sp.]MCC0003999.1 HNH endonuclease [Methylobacteriaceae bacterium]
MTNFLLKTNCTLHLNGAAPRPTNASQWEGASVSALRPKKLEGGNGKDVAAGDALVIWTHEDAEYGKGLGLTATAVAGHVTVQGETLKIVLRDVKLVQPHIRLIELSPGPSGSALLDSLKGDRHLRTIEVSDEHISQFWKAIGDIKRARQERIAAYTRSMPKSAEEIALADDALQIAEGFERRFAKVEVRPDQADFRRALIDLYGAKCLVSGSRIEAVIEAAHIVPFSEGVRFRNDVGNGLLLRADIHKLFDKFLISIRPEDSRVVVASLLKGAAYEKLEGRLVRHKAKREFLERQYEEFDRRKSLEA